MEHGISPMHLVVADPRADSAIPPARAARRPSHDATAGSGRVDTQGRVVEAGVVDLQAVIIAVGPAAAMLDAKRAAIGTYPQPHRRARRVRVDDPVQVGGPAVERIGAETCN